MNAFCSLKHHLHIGACHSSLISTPRCQDHGRNHFQPAFLSTSSDYYGNVMGTSERSYRAMPQVEQTLASYLSPDAASSLKASTLPSKPLGTSSALVGKGYAAAGQASSCLHTMAVLQAYQAELLKELDEGKEVNAEEIKELCIVPLGGLWQLWWQQRGIFGWPCLISKTVTGSSSWTPRIRLLACSATLLVPSSTGTRRPGSSGSADLVNPHGSQESERRPVTHCQAVSETARSDGSCTQRDTYWPAVHETPTVVAQDQGHAASLRHVETTLVLVSWPGAGTSVSPCDASDGRVPHWLEISHGWQPCPRSVEWSPSHMAYQLAGDTGSISDSETLSPRPKRSSCVGAHRQHNGGLLHKPPRSR